MKLAIIEVLIKGNNNGKKKYCIVHAIMNFEHNDEKVVPQGYMVILQG